MQGDVVGNLPLEQTQALSAIFPHRSRLELSEQFLQPNASTNDVLPEIEYRRFLSFDDLYMFTEQQELELRGKYIEVISRHETIRCFIPKYFGTKSSCLRVGVANRFEPVEPVL
jgi:hypothetical protein